ncbi:MAG: hypothetical protein MHMPM18_004012, partial [Marteilia pararefringens]
NAKQREEIWATIERILHPKELSESRQRLKNFELANQNGLPAIAQMLIQLYQAKGHLLQKDVVSVLSSQSAANYSSVKVSINPSKYQSIWSDDCEDDL